MWVTQFEVCFYQQPEQPEILVLTFSIINVFTRVQMHEFLLPISSSFQTESFNLVFSSSILPSTTNPYLYSAANLLVAYLYSSLKFPLPRLLLLRFFFDCTLTRSGTWTWKSVNWNANNWTTSATTATAADPRVPLPSWTRRVQFFFDSPRRRRRKFNNCCTINRPHTSTQSPNGSRRIKVCCVSVE